MTHGHLVAGTRLFSLDVRLGSGKEFEVKCLLDCKTAEFAYVLWSRTAPEKAYLGSSCRRLKDMLKKHNDDIEDRKAAAVADHLWRPGATK